MMILFLLVLHSGFLQFIFTTNHVQSFRETGKLQWDDALKNCTDTGGSLITLYDEDDDGFVGKYIKTILQSNPTVWLGLRKNRINVTTWSNGKVPTMSEFTTPSGLGGEQRCGAADGGRWQAYICSEKKKFMCQKGKNYILINETKNWCEALGYCRRHFTDLAIINNQQEKDDVLSRSMGTGFWIGLLHDEWRWVDQSCSTYRIWKNSLGKCSAITNISGMHMDSFNCEDEAVGLCSKGKVRIKVITSPQLSWEDSLKYCETNHSRLLWIEGEEDQKAVEQWLTYYFNKYTDSYPLWISMRQSSVFGFWIWSDRIVNWTNWKNGRQPELDEPFQCGVINGDFTWSNRSCSTPLSFICEEDIVWMNE